MNILIIVTNVGVYQNGDRQTGLWLSELTHIYHGLSASSPDTL